MNLIEALKPLLNAKTAKVALEVSAHPTKDDYMVVVAKPVVGPVSNTASEEMKLIVAGLATGIKIVAKTEAIEEELVAAVTEQAPQRNEWATRAAAITEAADTAAKKSAAAKKDKTAKTPAKQVEAKEPVQSEQAPAKDAETVGEKQETPAEFDIEL